MVPFLSLASDGAEGRIGRHQRRVRHTAAGQNPRWCHATHGTAAQDKAHFMDCSRGTGPRHEKLFESGDGHYTNGFHSCRWQETPIETRGTAVAKRAGLRYARSFRRLTQQQRPAAKDATRSASASAVRRARRKLGSSTTGSQLNRLTSRCRPTSGACALAVERNVTLAPLAAERQAVGRTQLISESK